MTMPTTVQTATCETCHGAGNVPHEQAGESHECYSCKGHGIAKKRYGDAYKSLALAQAALKRGTGVRCRSCKGNGTVVYPDTSHCYSCTEGLVVTVALPGMSWGDVPKAVKYSSGRGDVAEAYALAVAITVVGQNRGSTWNESYLGLGSITGCTDYGRRWDTFVADAKATGNVDSATAALIAEVRADIAKGTQWVHLTTADDSLATELIVVIHRGGYTVKAGNARPTSLAGLPPTYTSELLNAEIN